MTSLARHARAANPAPWPASQRLVIRWRAMDPATFRPFTLEWSIRVEGDALLADASTPDRAAAPALNALADVPIRWTHDDRLRIDHLDADTSAGDIPALNASVLFDGGTPRLLFARTTALGALGLPGGRYEPLGAALEPRRDDR